MIHDYVKDRQLELLAQGAFCKQYHPTNIAYTMGNIWKSQIDWYGLGVGPKYYCWSCNITEVLCPLLFHVDVGVYYYTGIEPRVKTFDCIQGRLVHLESLDYNNYVQILDASKEYNYTTSSQGIPNSNPVFIQLMLCQLQCQLRYVTLP
jgi:hypothetical protein